MGKVKVSLGVAVVLLLTLLCYYSNPYAALLSYYYLVKVVDMISTDSSRVVQQSQYTADIEWRLHRYEMTFSTCRQGDDKESYAWLTALVNDDFVIPNIVMGHMLNKLSCYRTKIAIVSSMVSAESRDALSKVGFQVVEKPGLDCDTMDRHYNREPSGKGYLGTHTRFWGWNMTQYDKILYLDGDYFPLTSLDSLFDTIEAGKISASYCSKPGIVDPCFNAGLSGFVPDKKLLSDLITYWTEMSYYSCPDDQRLLWYFFANNDNWVQIPYSYNVRRERYYPMNSYHFAGGGKEPRPWLWAEHPSKDEAVQSADKPLREVMDLVRLWWRYFYEALDEYQLNQYWEDSDLYQRIHA